MAFQEQLEATIFECLLVSQSFTMPGVILLWQPIQVLVAGLNGISAAISAFSSSVDADITVDA